MLLAAGSFGEGEDSLFSLTRAECEESPLVGGGVFPLKFIGFSRVLAMPFPLIVYEGSVTFRWPPLAGGSFILKLGRAGSVLLCFSPQTSKGFPGSFSSLRSAKSA